MSPSSKTPPDLPVRQFKGQPDWAAWLEKNHARSAGVWLRLAKTASGLKSVTYPEAVEAALCYGWIDGQAKGYDDSAWLQKFTPRRAKSIWSRINREKALALIQGGRMKPAGLAAINQAKADGRWAAAYDSPSRAAVPEDFQAELDKHPQAKAFFATLDSANRYAILFRIQTVKKAGTRARRIRQFIEMLSKKEKIHP